MNTKQSLAVLHVAIAFTEGWTLPFTGGSVLPCPRYNEMVILDAVYTQGGSLPDRRIGHESR